MLIKAGRLALCAAGSGRQAEYGVVLARGFIGQSDGQRVAVFLYRKRLVLGICQEVGSLNSVFNPVQLRGCSRPFE